MLKEKIVNKDARIAVIGLGYVGLPLACTFHQAGFSVTGFDISHSRVDMVNREESYIADVPSELVKFQATTDKQTLGDMDVILLCVPTPLKADKSPDLSYIEQESREIALHSSGLAEYSVTVNQGEKLVILESTTYPGTVRGVMLPLLKTIPNIRLAHCPERIDPGRTMEAMEDIPKIIGGIDDESAELACLLYGNIAKTVVKVSSVEVAEMTKVFENSFRLVNISFVNEMVELCRRLGVSIWEVIDAASTKPFGYMRFDPGLGAGGHCISQDPGFLSSCAKARDLHPRLIDSAMAINDQMPYYVRERIREIFSRHGDGLLGAKILVLGISYKKNVADTRESPALKLIHLLVEDGAKVSWHDPHVRKDPYPVPSPVVEHMYGQADMVVIAVDHDWYDWKQVVRESKRVFDCRGVTVEKKYPHVEVL